MAATTQWPPRRFRCRKSLEVSPERGGNLDYEMNSQVAVDFDVQAINHSRLKGGVRTRRLGLARENELFPGVTSEWSNGTPSFHLDAIKIAHSLSSLSQAHAFRAPSYGERVLGQVARACEGYISHSNPTKKTACPSCP